MLLKDVLPVNSTIQQCCLDGSNLSLDELSLLINRDCIPQFPLNEEIHSKLSKSVDSVKQAVNSAETIYGVTTGFGGMSNCSLDASNYENLQANLLQFLAAGAGDEVDQRHTRGAMFLRANVLLQGRSGTRASLVERILEFVRADAIPIVRELGSIGASGDLVPLSTIARAITGQSDRVKIRFDGEICSSRSVFEKLGLETIELQAKEGLALINGTSFSSAIAANATVAARNAMSISFMVHSLFMTSLCVDTSPFEHFVHESKPHPGQIWSAKIMRSLIKKADSKARSGDLVQDRYSLRCFPQYCGAIVEGIARIEKVVEIEMNSVSDNPLIDPDTGTFHQSGNFLGQYIGIAMDDLRRFIGLLAKHLDVQIASLVSPEFNRGLPPSLRGNSDKEFNMGLKGLQICGNSIMPMLTHHANPLVEHFPTHAEQFNQNINGLSWGAANLAWKSATTFQQYLAVASIFAIQATDLRAKQYFGHFDGRHLLSTEQIEFYDAVCDLLAISRSDLRPYLFDDSDRWLEQDVETLVEDIDLGSKSRLVQSVARIISSFRQFCESSP